MDILFVLGGYCCSFFNWVRKKIRGRQETPSLSSPPPLPTDELDGDVHVNVTCCGSRSRSRFNASASRKGLHIVPPVAVNRVSKETSI